MKKTIIILLAVVVLGAGYYVWQSTQTTSQTSNDSIVKDLPAPSNSEGTTAQPGDPNPEGQLTPTQEEAVRLAREYKPEGACAQVLTPAVHKASGAKYSFPSSCVAPGWEAAQ